MCICIAHIFHLSLVKHVDIGCPSYSLVKHHGCFVYKSDISDWLTVCNIKGMFKILDTGEQGIIYLMSQT